MARITVRTRTTKLTPKKKGTKKKLKLAKRTIKRK